MEATARRAGLVTAAASLWARPRWNCVGPPIVPDGTFCTRRTLTGEKTGASLVLRHGSEMTNGLLKSLDRRSLDALLAPAVAVTVQWKSLRSYRSVAKSLS